MATDGTSARKMRRIMDDEEDEEDELPDVSEAAEFALRKTESKPVRVGRDQKEDESDDEGLFSEEDEGEKSEEKEGTTSPSRKRRREDDQLSDAMDILEDDPFEVDEADQSKQAAIIQERSLPNLPNPAPTDSMMYHLELPKIVHLAPYPFDPSVTLPGPDSEAFTHPLSTIRHRKTPDGPRSNARFLKWSDGSMSLVLGAEVYDIPINPIPKAEQQFLVLSHHQAGLLRVVKRIDASMKIVPVSTASGAHKRLVTKQIGKGVQGERRTVKEFQPEGDPEAMKKLAEKAIEEKIRSRKRLDAKRRQTHIRYGGMRGERILEDEGDHQIGVGRYDDEGDGFVVSDDDELDERLNRIKSEGRRKYKDRKREKSEEEEEEEEEEEAEDEEDEDFEIHKDTKHDTPRRSRRRIVDDEDEE